MTFDNMVLHCYVALTMLRVTSRTWHVTFFLEKEIKN